ncbi:protein BPS1, chloroplastic-like [Olea europaea var. sylvestris]|uniref:protein BPS1, chloroplastic-like n=1 Tax=Olea europaea var. sylvestris TaxID=158386 RepID=UPI000C1D1F09|nr:protein BPS1, chloroplastic-like [Olea europaea var. sylvestris]XP_022898052.1 protein BPS1, chloroplastic-like [Olea europaea var. sylvestris]
MGRPQDPQRPLFFGNPFRMIYKGANLSPKLLDLLKTFEVTLAERLKKLKPVDREDILRLSWMRFAMESLCAIHTDIKTLITALELPVCGWDAKWIDVYLDNSVKLLDICIAFSSEISRLNQSHLFLQCVLHNLEGASKQFMRAQSSLDGWRKHISSKNPRIENCFAIMDCLAETIDLPKIKNSAKGKVLMRAMYGVKVITLFICSIFAAAFSGSMKKLVDLHVPETFSWAEAFTDLQASMNNEIRKIYSNRRITVLKDLEAVDTSVNKLYPIVQDGLDPVEAEALQYSTSDLRTQMENFSQGLDLLAKEVDSFFQIVLTGRDALLCNLRVGGNVTKSVQPTDNIQGQAVR